MAINSPCGQYKIRIMAGLFKELTQLFSFRSAIKSNILSSSYSPIGMGGSTTGAGFRSSSNATFNSFTSSRLLGSWYSKMIELHDYELTELSNTVVTVLKDYLISNINQETDIVTFSKKDTEEDKKYEQSVNAIFKDLDLVGAVKDHLPEIIYYGSYCRKIDWDKQNRKWNQYELLSPYDVVSVQKHGKLIYHLVRTKENAIVSVAPNSIIRLGKADLHLVNDVNEAFFEELEGKKVTSVKEDTILKKYDVHGSYPLYYNLIGKVKEYILKDQLVSLLSIKDLIQPLLLLIRVDKQTDPAEATRLAVNTENLINKYSDLSAIFGANFSIMDLMDSILNNIRVLPDYQSTMGDMNSVDLSKLSDKIREIRGDQDNLREDIYSSLGIPRALFAGDTTKWEAIKSSQRLNSKITGIITDLTDSLRDIAAQFYYLLSGNTLPPDQIEINLFVKTDIDYNTAISSAEITSQLLESINRVLESTQRFVQESKLIDQDAYLKYVCDQLKATDPKILDFVTEAQLAKFIKDLKSEQSESGGFGGGFSRF